MDPDAPAVAGWGLIAHAVRPTSPQLSADRLAHVEENVNTQVDEARDAMEMVRRQLAETPATMVIANHVMGLYELAAIHLSAAPPDLTQAALAIDAVGCLVEGLGDRLGEDAPTMRDALGNIRIAFVQIKSAQQADEPPAAD